MAQLSTTKTLEKGNRNAPKKKNKISRKERRKLLKGWLNLVTLAEGTTLRVAKAWPSAKTIRSKTKVTICILLAKSEPDKLHQRWLRQQRNQRGKGVQPTTPTKKSKSNELRVFRDKLRNVK